MIPNSNTHITLEGNGDSYAHFNLWDYEAARVSAANVVLGEEVHSAGDGDGNRGDGHDAGTQPQPTVDVLGRLEQWSNKPEWVKGYRDHQTVAVGECLAAYGRGVKVVILDAPTGSGKTLIGEMVRIAMGRVKGLYVCSGKQLQDQFIHDFPYAKVLKGRSNYPTVGMPFPEFSAADCVGTTGEDSSCHLCPSMRACRYVVAKREAKEAELAVLNTTYLLTEANGPGMFSKQRFAVIDECDMLEDELMRFVEFRVSEGMLKELGVEGLKKGVHKATIKTWMEDILLPELASRMEELKDAISDEMKKKAKTYERMWYQGKRVAETVEDENWVRDYETLGFGDRARETDAFIMRPVTVGRDGQWALWRHSQQWLVMSATIISAQQFARDLGLKDGEWEVVKVPMTFPVENRPVVVYPVANMTYKTEQQERPKLAKGLVRVLNMHGDDNVLVHTNSYKLTEWLYNQLVSSSGVQDPSRIMHYLSGRDRDSVLQRFRQKGGVLLGPSLDRGIDLPGDLCRVMVVAKCPYPSLADKQVSTRLHTPGGQVWLGVKTVRTIVQMTGRGVRNKDDHAVTYILDSQFGKNVWGKHRVLFPDYWRDAVDEGVNSEYAAALRRGT